MNIYKEAEKRGYQIFYGGRVFDTVTGKFLKKGKFSTVEKKEIFETCKKIFLITFPLTLAVFAIIDFALRLK